MTPSGGNLLYSAWLYRSGDEIPAGEPSGQGTASYYGTMSVDLSVTGGMTLHQIGLSGYWATVGMDELRIAGSWATATGSTASPDLFAAWATSYALSGSEVHPSADPDGDGSPNLLEYALGTIPNASASRPNLGYEISDWKLRITFERIADPDLVYEIWASPDLADWGASPVWSSTGAANVAGEFTYTDSVASPPRRFLRLKVTRP